MKAPKKVDLCRMAAAFRTGGIIVGKEMLNFLIPSSDVRVSSVFPFMLRFLLKVSPM